MTLHDVAIDWVAAQVGGKVGPITTLTLTFVLGILGSITLFLLFLWLVLKHLTQLKRGDSR